MNGDERQQQQQDGSNVARAVGEEEEEEVAIGRFRNANSTIRDNNDDDDDDDDELEMHAARETQEEEEDDIHAAAEEESLLRSGLSSQQPPRTLVSDLHGHLHDQDLADVHLCGTDGKQVVAVRSILAMRSEFFKGLFFGSFCERKSSKVTLGFSSLVLKAVVEYCYTDEIKTTFENLSFEETARSMVGLVAAGNYFQLLGLQNRAYRLTCLMMDEYPALACSVLDESLRGEEIQGQYTAELGRVAQGIIRLRTESALLPPDMYGSGVQSLGPSAMERVMADRHIQASELAMFQCLKKWADHVPETNADQTTTAATTTDGSNHHRDDEVREQRHKMAGQLAARIDLSKIAPSDLSTTVADSGLVSLELLCSAYRAQALQAEQAGFLSFGNEKRQVAAPITSGKVIVQGAGLAAVNGTYLFCIPGDYIGVRSTMRYSRSGSIPGLGRGEFGLYMGYSIKDGARMWHLSFVPMTSEGISTAVATTSTPLELYAALALSEMDPPPMQKWFPVAASHDRLRSLMGNSKTSRTLKHTSFAPETDDERAGNPPPICIWLPADDESTDSISRRLHSNGGASCLLPLI